MSESGIWDRSLARVLMRCWGPGGQQHCRSKQEQESLARLLWSSRSFLLLYRVADPSHARLCIANLVATEDTARSRPGFGPGASRRAGQPSGHFRLDWTGVGRACQVAKFYLAAAASLTAAQVQHKIRHWSFKQDPEPRDAKPCRKITQNQRWQKSGSVTYEKTQTGWEGHGLFAGHAQQCPDKDLPVDGQSTSWL